MSKKVLILSASPRKGGNSDVLCDTFLRGATEAGHSVEKIFLRCCFANKLRKIFIQSAKKKRRLKGF